jgi:hypothetical protein
MTIQDAIKLLAGNGDRRSLSVGASGAGIVCKVKELDGLNCVCEPVDGSADITDVRLVADDAEDGFVLVPAVDSYVVVEMINATAGYLGMVSKVTEVYWKVGTVLVSVNNQGVLIQKGNDTMKQILTLLIEAIQVVVVLQGSNPDYAKLTQALTKVNNLTR